jgi:hypothetical protein
MASSTLTALWRLMLGIWVEMMMVCKRERGKRRRRIAACEIPKIH